VIAALASARRVIAFDNPGIGKTEASVPDTIDAAADLAAAFVATLDDGPADILGWSMGGMIAQVVAWSHPGLVRRVVLAATMPPGTPQLAWGEACLEAATASTLTDEEATSLFFTHSEAGRAAGRAWVERMPRAPRHVSLDALAAQVRAIARYAESSGTAFSRLREIKSAAFVAHGDQDRLFPVIGAMLLARELRASSVAVYPDSGHAFMSQYPERFADDVLRFLEA
jgi:pimeloyl-ACP methyl ester carboxylesterase